MDLIVAGKQNGAWDGIGTRADIPHVLAHKGPPLLVGCLLLTDHNQDPKTWTFRRHSSLSNCYILHSGLQKAHVCFIMHSAVSQTIGVPTILAEPVLFKNHVQTINASRAITHVTRFL